jgi:amino acid adenylation domain-containing protein
MRNTGEMFRQRVAATPDRLALTSGGARYTWQQLFDRAVAMRNTLRASGVERGSVVAIMADHSPAQVVGMFAALLADAAFTLVNTHLRQEQVAHQISDADVALVIAQEKYAAPLEELLRNRGTPLVVVDETGLAAAGAAPARADPAAAITRDIPTDVACIIYTSGSTGRAKGVVVPHRTLTDGARIVSGYLRITPEDRILSILPYSFDYGLNQLLSVVHTGASIVLLSFAFPQDLIDTLVRERITGFAAVPSLWPQLLHPRYAEAPGKPDFPDLRYLTTGGGPHSEAILRRIVSFFPRTEVIIIYGLTESFRSAYLPFAELFKRIGSIGKAVPEVELLVLNESGEPCQPGETGELYHRGAFITYGYLNNPELTAQKFVDLQTGGAGCLPERAVRSGDLVHLDEDGYIYFHGRADLQIKSRGYRVSPGEVEETALAFPGVRIAGAFGVPDPDAGEAVVLAYDSFDHRPVDEDGLRRHLKDRLPYYAVPAVLRFFAQMPLTGNGKIAYAAVREIVVAERSGGKRDAAG